MRECREFAEKNGYQVREIYADRAVSGRTDDRAEFQRMLSDMESHTFSAIIVWKIDRFGRNREELAFNKMKCRKHKVKILYAREHIPEGSTGILVESLLEGMAEYYSVELSEKIIRGMTDNALKGMVTSGATPLGYRIGEDKRLVIVPEEASTVKRIFDMYAAGDNFADIISEMNRMGLYTKRGEPFNKNSLGRMLRNEKYIGVYRWRDIVNEDGIPAIITKEIFNNVQRRLDKRALSGGRRSKMDYLLSGKLYCGECGEAMQGESGNGRSGETHYYYTCTARKRKKICKKENHKKHELELLVAEIIFESVLQNPLIKEAIADDIMKLQGEQENSSPLFTVEKQLEDVKNAIRNLLRLAERGTITETTADRLEELEKEKQELAYKIVREQQLNVHIPREQVLYWLDNMSSGDVCDPEFQRRLIDTFVNAVYVYEDRLKLVFNMTSGNDTVTRETLEGADMRPLAGFDNRLHNTTTEFLRAVRL
ncbi:recombinase RecD [Clostridia bacterium]|nr:recombinase RecD [Clostridia bacterium]